MQIVPVYENPNNKGLINIFFHGYWNGSNSGQKNLRKKLIDAAPPGKSYLCKWKSGSPSGTLVQTLGDLAALINPVGRVSRIGWLTYKKATGSDISTPALVGHFTGHRNRAKNIGNELLYHLSKVEGIQKAEINLIGHSLGALIIYTALTNEEISWTHYKVRDVLLIGGAIESNPKKSSIWDDILGKISGNIYNCHSKKDKVLKMEPRIHKRIGVVGIPNKSKRIIQYNYSATGHLGYWPKINNILNQTIHSPIRMNQK